jgi:Protein kinase domain
MTSMADKSEIDAAIFNDNEYDSDYLSWTEQSGDSLIAFNNSEPSDNSDNSDDDSHMDSDDSNDSKSEIDSIGGFLEARLAGIRRRLSTSTQRQDSHEDNTVAQEQDNNQDTDHSKNDRRNQFRGLQCLQLFCLRRPSTIILGVSFLIWLYVFIMSTNNNELEEQQLTTRQKANLIQQQSYQLKKQRERDAHLALGSAARKSNDSKKREYGPWTDSDSERDGMHQGSKTNKETLPTGCVPADWHSFSFPNCNSLHEMNVKEDLMVNNERPMVAAYIANGLWRDVFQMTDDVGELYVLKMMKGEHDIDARNFDRHRRDALVMERFTSSSYVVSMYGFCGNTVVTEFISRGLYNVIQSNSTQYPSRNSPKDRLQLSLDVAKSIQVLHEIKGGPIVHTDLQTDQFMVDHNGRVKVNDFNRCRFITHRNQTGEQCPFRVPTAPGAYRSPEEYEYEGLSEKLDIFSTTNVLYEILTGHEVWDNVRISRIQANVKQGANLPIPPEYLKPSSMDAGLVSLIGLGRQRSPSQRISASEMVTEIENLLQAHA